MMAPKMFVKYKCLANGCQTYLINTAMHKQQICHKCLLLLFSNHHPFTSLSQTVDKYLTYMFDKHLCLPNVLEKKHEKIQKC